MPDLNKYIQNLKGNTSSNSNLKNNTIVSTAPEIKGSKFDDEILPLMEQKGLDKDYDYASRKLVENAYNGSYSSIKKKMYADGNKEVGDALSSLETVSQKFKNELLKEQPSIDEIKRLIRNSNIYASRVEDAFSKNQNSAYKFDIETGKIKDSKQYYKDKETPDKGYGSSSNAYVEKSVGFTSIVGMIKGDPYLSSHKNVNLLNEDPVYKYLEDVDSRFKRDLKTKMQSKVKMWYDKALIGLNPNDNYKSEINSKALQISEDMLNHIVKYGTVDPDDEAKDLDKKTALSLLKNLRSSTNGKERLDLLNNEKVKEQLQTLSNKLGYYGNEMLYKKYKDLNQNDSFIDNPNNFRQYRKDIERIDKSMNIYNGFREDSKDFKTDAVKKLSQLKSQNEYLQKVPFSVFEQFKTSVFDDRGNIVSYEKFKLNLASQFNYGVIKINGNIYNPQGLKGSIGYNDKEEVLKEQYYNLTKGYKQVLNDTKAKYKYKNTQAELGIGNIFHEAVYYESIDLKTDDLGLLKNFNGPKQTNVNKLWNALRNTEGKFGDISKAYILPANNKDEKNNIALIERNELNNYANSSDQVMKDFLKSAKDPSDIRMIFKKYSNVPGYAQYEFQDKVSGKSVVALVNNNRLGSRGVQEDTYMNSYDTVEEEAFRIRGFLPLPERKNNKSKVIVKNPKVIWDSQRNAYVIDALVPDRKIPGNYTKFLKSNDEPITLPQGLSLQDAEKFALNLINNSVNSIN